MRRIEDIIEGTAFQTKSIQKTNPIQTAQHGTMGKKGGGGVRMKQMGPSKEQRAMMKQMQDMQSGGGMMNPLQDLMQMPPEIHLPPTPDKSMKIIWPMRKFFSKVCVWCVCFII